MVKDKKKNNLIKYIRYIALFLLFLLFFIYFFRFISSKELDDLNPFIECDLNLIEKSDIFWVIPIYENKSISDNREWCNYIASLNKTIGMHGVYHSYNEFGEDRGEEYLYLGIKEFEKCFGYLPYMFKAPQMNMTLNNMKMVNLAGLENRGIFSQLFHKVYHCSDTGTFSNRFMDYF